MDVLWYNYDLSNYKDQIKATKQIQKICRESLEYDEWQRKCKYKDSTTCPVCSDNYYDNNSKCESHHHPKTLFAVVEEIMDSHLEKNDLDEFTGLAIVGEIMELHLFNKVNYINLCQHCHKKYHAGHPDVIQKINDIFDERERIEREKEVVEDEDTDIELVTKEEIEIPEDIKLVSQLGMEIPPPISQPGDVQTVKLLDADGNEPHIELFKKTPKPEVLNIETGTDFVSIDIDDL